MRRGTVNGRNPAPVEIGSLSHYLQGFYNQKEVLAEFLNHQQYEYGTPLECHSHGHRNNRYYLVLGDVFYENTLGLQRPCTVGVCLVSL